jgi:hypothetical protein
VIPVNPAGTEYLSFAPDMSGWAIFRSAEFDPARRSLFVRFGRRVGDVAEPKIVVAEIYLARPTGVGLQVLRDLPLAKIEAAVNQPAHYAEVLALLPPANRVMVPFPWKAESSWWFAKPPKRRAPRLRISIPSGQPKPDEFYQQVAERFAYLTTVSRRPATDLAEANGVKPTTVHGWVKEARRRGLLPSGERSRQ